MITIFHYIIVCKTLLKTDRVQLYIQCINLKSTLLFDSITAPPPPPPTLARARARARALSVKTKTCGMQ